MNKKPEMRKPRRLRNAAIFSVISLYTHTHLNTSKQIKKTLH